MNLDRPLFTELDATQEVRRPGRSAVIRRALAAYLRLRRRDSIAEAYAPACAHEEGLGTEWERWQHQGAWPDG